jgi:hydroxymethylbilane synthase
MRRAAQLQIFRPDLQIVPFRGNVTTRLIKIKKGEADATLLALAGLKRIGMENEATEILDVERFIPAVGQGIIAIECREDNEKLRAILEQIQHPPTLSASLAERKLLATLDGSCRTPIAGYARFEGGRLRLSAMIAKADGSMHLITSRTGDAADAALMGEDAAKELLARGGGQCIA